MGLAALLASAAPAYADGSPFSIVFGFDQKSRPAIAIKAFGPGRYRTMFSIDAIDDHPMLYQEFKPALAPAPPQQPPFGKLAKAASMLRPAAMRLLHLLTNRH